MVKSQTGARGASQRARRPIPNPRGWVIAMVDIAPQFQTLEVRHRVSLVASMVAFDEGGCNHQMSSVVTWFRLVGHLLYHDACSWESIRDTIELCSGLGGLGQGLLGVGFNPVAACDQNGLMLELYRTQLDVPLIRGDVADLTTVKRLWDVYPKSATICAGVSCQPYTRPWVTKAVGVTLGRRAYRPPWPVRTF